MPYTDFTGEAIDALAAWHARSGWTGLHALTEQMPGVEFKQSLHRKGRAGAIPQPTLQTVALVRLDAHPGIDPEAASVFPHGRGQAWTCAATCARGT